ncbi:hypothetical protein ALC56_09596 [Trachymyrmex septentrionalis]|uniref:Leucine-rich repeat-containing protein 40 n=1 Tax=Trachymyrmex septentrionalis TaxID=34720 RepID=A0A195F7L9_9HYME|nr:hypothetical protein ALC56_09596 [Trachymyrmex septentrionalis]
MKYKRKTSATFEDTIIKKKCRILENGIEIFIPLLKFDEPLFKTFNNNIWWLNLTDVNISNNNIDLLPRKLGALHCLRRLDVSHNCLKWRDGWSWLKEARIKRTLRFLDMSNNSLFELSEFIWNLTALEELNISHNFLGHLPQGIKKRPVQNLRTLDLSHNLLKYLPIEINRLKLQTINISMNPFFVRDEENWQGAVMFSSLSQLAAKILRLYCRYVFFSTCYVL